MRVLFVCTANICRSAAAQQLLRSAVGEVPGVEVESAGVSATPGRPGCQLAPALAAGGWQEHRSRRLDAHMIRAADLVLTASTEHRTAVVRLVPAARQRTFTIIQAGRISAWLSQPAGPLAVAEFRGRGEEPPWLVGAEPGDPRLQVTAMPSEVGQRWEWLAQELDAGRAIPDRIEPRDPDAGAPDGGAVRRRWLGRRRPEPAQPRISQDLPDPHMSQSDLHLAVHRSLQTSIAGLAGVLTALAEAGQQPGPASSHGH